MELQVSVFTDLRDQNQTVLVLVSGSESLSPEIIDLITLSVSLESASYFLCF